MKSTKTKAIAYYRSAGHPITYQQRASYDQRELIERYAEKNNIKIVEQFASCSKRYANNELKHALNYCKLHPEIKFLLVKSFDRISRSIEDFYSWKSAFIECGVQLISVTEPTDNSPVGQFTEAMSITMAQLDNHRRSEQVKAGLRRKKAANS